MMLHIQVALCFVFQLDQRPTHIRKCMWGAEIVSLLEHDTDGALFASRVEGGDLEAT